MSVAASLSLVVGVGCSLVLGDLNTTQCSTNADCAAIGAGWLCQTGVCAAPASTVNPDGSVDAPAPDCVATASESANAICTRRLATPAICLKKAQKCHALDNSVCHVQNTDGLATSDAGGSTMHLLDETVYFGSFKRLDNEAEQAGAEASTMAFREINRARGIPPAVTGRPYRQVGLVVCDYTQDAEGGYKWMKELEIPAMIGPHASTDSLALYQNFTSASDILLVTGVAQDPSLNTIQSGTQFVHIAPNAVGQALALQKLVVDVEARIRAKFALAAAPADSIKVATEAEDSAIGAGFIAAFGSNKLVWNDGTGNVTVVAGPSHPADNGTHNGGKAAASGDALYLRTEYKQTGPAKFDFITPSNQLKAFGPHIIGIFGDDSVGLALNFTENNWDDAKYPIRPYYLINSFGIGNNLAPTASNIGRIRAVRYAPKPESAPLIKSTLDTYGANINFAFGQGVGPNDQAHYDYDAAYLIAFSYYAAGSIANVTGAAMGGAMDRFVAPAEGKEPSFVLGPGSSSDNPSQIFQQLSISGSKVSIAGTAGVLNPDPESGGPKLSSLVAEVLCGSGSGPGSYSFVPSGLTYDFAKDTISGTFSNPMCIVP